MGPIRGMMVSVGSAEGPALASLDKHRPGHVLFVVSGDTRRTVEEKVLPSLPEEYEPDCKIVEITNPQAVSSSFGEIQAQALVWARTAGLDPVADVALDITGGTKAMSVALALAGVDQGVKTFIYVGGDTRAPDTGRVIAGHEQVVIDPNPLNREDDRSRSRMYTGLMREARSSDEP